ncbi:hypothetical protein ISS05_02960 [Candidatus Woesearchaeota archaeon]|nr:hypothetical protein [Candidatus Woesearchaeota archaeon]
MKKRLSQQQEFEIMKLVLDKFLWLGFIILAFGMYTMVTDTISTGLIWSTAGTFLLILFMWIIVKEYEIVK